MHLLYTVDIRKRVFNINKYQKQRFINSGHPGTLINTITTFLFLSRKILGPCIYYTGAK